MRYNIPPANSATVRIRAGYAGIRPVPLVMEIRETSDAGTPVVVSNPDGPQAKVYREIAAKVWDQLAAGKGGRAAPAIVFE
jgi:ATP-binding protein involved in chromosome partitioning